MLMNYSKGWVLGPIGFNNNYTLFTQLLNFLQVCIQYALFPCGVWYFMGHLGAIQP